MLNNIDPLAQSQLFTLNGDTVISSAAGGTSQLQNYEIIDRKYKIIALLGEGGMGAVHKAQHLFLNQEVALKTFRAPSLTDEPWVRFQREAQAIARLSHKNIVQFFDLGLSDDNRPYYTMECLQGESLADRLKAIGRLPLNEAITIFLPVCHALSFAHSKGIIHRDLKPANIFLATDASGNSQADTVKIVDFGVAGFVSETANAQKLTRTGSIFGSPLYMSPEQCLGQNVTERADIYSFGCTLFETLTGRPPFHGANVLATMLAHQHAPIPSLNEVAGGAQFPARLDKLIGRMLAKYEDQRIQSFEEVAAELEQIQEDSHQTPSAILNDAQSGHKSEHIPIGRKKIMVLAGVLCLIVVMVVLGLSHPATKPTVTTIPVKPETWNGKQFYQGIAEDDGIRYKKWIFPQSTSVDIGTFNGYGFDQFPMIGKCNTPYGAAVQYRPVAKIIETPELMKGFTDGDFCSIGLSKLSPTECEKILAVLPKFKSVWTLAIFDVDVEEHSGASDPFFVPKCIKEINQFPNLIQLMTDILPDDKSLGQISRLKMLKSLHLGFQGGNPRNITSLSGPFRESTKLENLQLWSARVTSQTIKDLCTCPNLSSLTIQSQSKQLIATDQIADLDGIRKLDTLDLRTVHYSPLLLDTVRKCHSLRKLNCLFDSDLDKDEITSLRKAVPDAAVEISWVSRNKQLQKQDFAPLGSSVH